MELLKKPLNVIEQPVGIFIQKQRPIFKDSGKSQQVNVSTIMRNQETNTQSYDHAVLAVSRSENQTRYGQRSYFGIVNKEFRPPLIDPEFDLMPLSRIPRPRTMARTNPGSSITYHTQNSSDLDVSSMIDDRRINASVRPNFGLRVEKPTDYEITPDLEFNAPPTFGPAGSDIPVYIRPESDLECAVLEKNNPDTCAGSGYETNVTSLDWADYDYELKDPYARTCAYSGIQGPQLQQTTPLEDLELESKTTARNVYYHPSTGVDGTNYTPQETKTITRVCPQAHSVAQPASISRNLQRKKKLKPTMGYVGSYDPWRTATRPSTFQHVNAHLKQVNRPTISVTS